ncbi:MAG: hypothetical protein IKZ82_00710 [Clostridia bacterium]|nr:hypothetical protein [Clostridia bacterium]
MKKLFSLFIAVIMLAGVLAGCSTYTADPSTEQNPSSTQSAAAATDAPTGREKTKEGYGSVTIAYTEPNTLNLLTSQSNLDEDVFYLISVMLYRPYGNEIKPEMAVSCEFDETAKTYTYKIREAYYQDGSQITAADFVYYILHSVKTTAATAVVECLKNGKEFLAGQCDVSEVGIHAIDDLTFVLELNDDAAEFDPEMRIYPMKQSYAEEKGDALGGTAQDFLCSGPYIITDWTYGASLSFTKNPDYWDAENTFQIKDVKVIHGTDANAQYNMFTTGEADILQSIGVETEALLHEYSTPYMTGALQGIQFNTTGFYFDGTTFAQKDAAVTALLANDNFRKALCYALDRETIVNTVDSKSKATNRYLELSRGTTEGKTFGEEFPIDIAPISGDEAQAVEYLKKAMEELGYTDVSQLPKVKYLTFENDTFRLMAETVLSEWKRVLGITNIEIELKPVQDAIMSMVFMNYDIYYQATQVDKANQLTCMRYWKTGGALSDIMGAGAPFSSIYSNPEFDALVETACSEFDTAKRYALVAQAEEMFLNDFIFIPIMNQGGITAVSNRIKGYEVVDISYGFMLAYAEVTD